MLMALIKELHLVVRVLYTLGTVLFFSEVTGFSLYTSFLGLSWMVFLSSFAFQYLVLHPVLHNAFKTPRARVFVLIGCCIFSIAGALFALWMTPSLGEASSYESTHAFVHKVAFWASIFAVSVGKFVAVACARRAFDQHGLLNLRTPSKQ